MASEGELGRKWDRCLADSAVKLGKGGEGRAQGEDPGRSGAGRRGAPAMGAPPAAGPLSAAGPSEGGPWEARCPPAAPGLAEVGGGFSALWAWAGGGGVSRGFSRSAR